MLEALTDKLNQIFRKLSGKGRLSEKDIDEALRQVRLALLEADVNLQVVKSFTARVRERSIGKEVLENLNPAQVVVKIVYDELAAVLGGGQSKLVAAPHPPTSIMLVGLQGSGKTTTAAKLALNLRRNGGRPLLIAADTHRPAAMEQLAILGKQLDIPVYREEKTTTAPQLCQNGLKNAQETLATWVIVDTAGRLNIDEAMMEELREIKQQIKPTEILLVVDAMTGQDAVRVAEDFHKQVGITGLILTKMDGDARGGAALSIRSVTGVPIKFLGVGEKLDALEPFYPDRLASRILGMGDVVTLVEKAQEVMDEKKAKELEKKLKSATFDLEDFLGQLQDIKKMGSISQMLEMIPGMSGMAKKLPAGVDDNQLKKVEAIIRSMTPWERRNTPLIDGSRRKRIARGSGTTPQDVNQLLNQFTQVQKLIKDMGKKKYPDVSGMFRRM
ncbi:MAG: signal recognition particle protein [Dehalococcoidia bacterium]|nr:signal recognition particle protein [Dehalococcoidia bacterium]